MAWPPIGTQFCLEIGFGVLLALAFVPEAPVGAFFYRLLGATAALPILVAVAVPVAVGQLAWSDPIVLAAAPALLALPLYAGRFRERRFAVGIGVALVGTATAVVLSLLSSLPNELGPAALALGVLSALATGAVAGSVGLAMVLGHWYLTIPNLSVDHLRRLNRVTVVSMVVSLVLVGLSCLAFAEPLNAARSPLFGPLGLFHLGTRLAVGLLLPLAFAWMTASSLRFRNTRSATGILYASTVLVLIGTAVSLSLQDAYGIPL